MFVEKGARRRDRQIRMTQIIVRPDQLNAIAQSIRAHARRIQNAVMLIDSEMRRLGQDSFSGANADAIRAHYHNLRDRLMNFEPILNKFAGQLEDAAEMFRRADADHQTGDTARGGDWQTSATYAAGSTPTEISRAERMEAIRQANQTIRWRLW
jgi:WXG100 family type VII secretion target